MLFGAAPMSGTDVRFTVLCSSESCIELLQYARQSPTQAVMHVHTVGKIHNNNLIMIAPATWTGSVAYASLSSRHEQSKSKIIDHAPSFHRRQWSRKFMRNHTPHTRARARDWAGVQMERYNCIRIVEQTMQTPTSFPILRAHCFLRDFSHSPQWQPPNGVNMLKSHFSVVFLQILQTTKTKSWMFFVVWRVEYIGIGFE